MDCSARIAKNTFQDSEEDIMTLSGLAYTRKLMCSEFPVCF